MNKKMTPAELHQKIFENMMTEFRGNLTESEINELFGFGKKSGGSASKPKQELTAEFLTTAPVEEIATVISEVFDYWGANANDMMDKALDSAMQPLSHLWQEGKENAENAAKFAKAVVSAIKTKLANVGDAAKDGAASLPRLIIMGVAICMKVGAQGVQTCADAAKFIYESATDWCVKAYESVKTGFEKGVNEIKDTAIILIKVSSALVILAANQIVSNGQKVVDFIGSVGKDIANGVQAAALIARGWLSTKAAEFTKFISDNINIAREKIVSVYNAIDKAVRKAWMSLVNSVLDFFNNVKITAAKIADKISDTMTAAGDRIVAGKDKVVVAGINKAVKMLSKNYSEDDVVAIVRKAYNEGLTFEMNGTCIINEAYYSKTTLSRV